MIIENPPSTGYVKVDTNNALLVSGIEIWIDSLVSIGGINSNNDGAFTRMKDNETGSTFEIRKVPDND